MFKRAVILSGGLGTRLRPYTIVLPKPLMPIGEFYFRSYYKAINTLWIETYNISC